MNVVSQEQVFKQFRELNGDGAGTTTIPAEVPQDLTDLYRHRCGDSTAPAATQEEVMQEAGIQGRWQSKQANNSGSRTPEQQRREGSANCRI